MDPRRPTLVGGSFNALAAAATIAAAAGLARAQWASPPGPQGFVNVYALAVYNSELYMGGDFPNVGAANNFIARWDGANWADVGGGLGGTVRTLTVYVGTLAAGGDILPGTFNEVRRWNGANWATLGSFPLGFTVTNLASWNGLLVAECAGNILRWNGANWANLLPGTVFCSNDSPLLPQGPNLYIGGQTTSGPNQWGVARWNGATITGWNFPGVPGVTNALAILNNAPIAATPKPGFPTVCAVYRFDGTNWTQLGGDFTNPPIPGAGAGIECLTVYNGELYAGGNFTSVGATAASSIAKWTGATWTNVGAGVVGTVYSMAPVGTSLDGGSPFLAVGGNFNLAGGNPANHIAFFTVPVPTGACCMSNGNCINTTQTNCPLTAGGVFQGANTTCAAITCPPPPATGGCCMSNGNCLILTAANCAIAPGGVYRGNGTTCGAPPCPVACYPNCDNSTSAPILNVQDFACFLNKYAAGCS